MIHNIVLLYGGLSGEYEVSCVSAGFLEKMLQNSGYRVLPVYVDQTGVWHLQETVKKTPPDQIPNPCHLVKTDSITLKTSNNSFPVDFVFPIIHGTTGEDGKLQGLLEFYNIPYAGSGVLTSAICMDKFYSKTIFMNSQIPTIPFIKIDKADWNQDNAGIIRKIADEFDFPVFVKPSNMGSSVGVSKAKNLNELSRAINEAFLYDNQILCEKGISAREVEVSILGTYPDYKVSIAGEIIPNHEFYSYEAKYLDQNGARLVIPADISEEQYKQIRDLAILAFKSVNGDGFARIDFFIEKKHGKNIP